MTRYFLKTAKPRERAAPCVREKYGKGVRERFISRRFPTGSLIFKTVSRRLGHIATVIRFHYVQRQIDAGR
jgi:hypothetical protein